MASAIATENMSAAEKLQLEHAQAAEGHHVTVEEVPDEDLKPHLSSAGPADSSSALSDKAAGNRKDTSAAAAAAAAAPSSFPAKASKLDIQSQELFPELGAPKAQATKNVPKWGAANVLGDKTNTTIGNGTGPVATTTNGTPKTATPSSGTTNPQAKSNASGVPLVRLPGRYTETLNLEPQELKPREQLRRPLAQILQDINRTSRAQVKSVPAARGQRFEVVGPQESAQQALKELVKQIGSTQTIHVPIPQSARAHIIGRQGATIKALQEKTGAKIDVPKDDKKATATGAVDDLDDDVYINVKIEGDSISAAAARQQIENIVGERSAKVNTRVKDIPAEFYPFIANGNFAQGSSAQMRIPPHTTWSSQVTTPVPASGQRPDFQSAQDHHIQLEGDRQAVLALRQALERRVAELRQELLLQQLEIQRGRHQFIIGHSGLSPEEFFEQTGCAIILPTDEDDDAITVVGPQDRIEAAIQKAEELAQSMSLNNVDHLKWTRKQAPNNAAVHSRNVTRYLRQRNEINRLEKQYRARINTPVSGDGALPWELYLPQGQSFTAASSDIRNIFESHPPSRMSTVDVDPFFHPYMQNEVSRQVREQYGVQLVVPTVTESGAPVLLVYEAPGPAGSSYDIPRTAPSPADVQAFSAGLRAAEKHIADLMSQQDRVATITTDVPVKFHEKLRRFIKKEQDRQISAGQPRIRVSNLGTTITLRGPQKATQSLAEKIEAFVEQEKADEKERDFTLEFSFPQEFANHLIGKQGSRIRDLRDKYDVEIQVENGKVQLKGPKAKASAAQRHIESLGKDLADESTMRLIVDPKHHGELIGQKGSTITRLQNKHNVMIFFPRADKIGQEEGAAASGEAGGKPHRQQAPNEIVIRGPSKGVSAAYDELKGLADYMNSKSHTAIVLVQRKQLPSIIGANGSAVDQLRDQTNTNIELPAKDSTEDPAEIKIKGTKEAVQKAKKILEEKKAVFDDTVSKTIDVERKYHRTLIGAGGSNLRELVTKAGGSDDARERARLIQFPKQEADGNTITLEGRAAVVENLIKQIQDFVAFRESQVTISVDVPTDKHRSLIGRGGEAKKRLEEQFSVTIDIPRQGSADTAVKITGEEANVEKAKDHIVNLTKDKPSETLQVPRNLHQAISGERGQFFRKLKSDFHVSVDHAGQPPPPKPTTAARANGGAMPLITDEADQDTHSWNVVAGASDEEGEIPWVLKGSPENIEKAKALITAAMAQAKDNVTGYLVLPDPSTYRHVIGQGGSKVNSIRKQCGCTIDVPRKDVGEAIKVVGTKEDVEKAKELILAAVRDGESGSRARE